MTARLQRRSRADERAEELQEEDGVSGELNYCGEAFHWLDLLPSAVCARQALIAQKHAEA